MNKYRERRSPLGLYRPRALLALDANNTMKYNNHLLLKYAIPKQRNTKARRAEYIGNAVLLKGTTGPEHYWLLAANNTMKCKSLFVAGICYSEIKKYKSTPC